MQLGDDQVLVVAAVADDGRGARAAPEQIAFEVVRGSDRVAGRRHDLGELQSDAVVHVRRVGRRVTRERRAVAVDRVQVQGRQAPVVQAGDDRVRRDRLQVGAGDVRDALVVVGVEGDVVVDELTPVRVDRRDRRVALCLQLAAGRRVLLGHRRAEGLEPGQPSSPDRCRPGGVPGTPRRACRTGSRTASRTRRRVRRRARPGGRAARRPSRRPAPGGRCRQGRSCRPGPLVIRGGRCGRRGRRRRMVRT